MNDLPPYCNVCEHAQIINGRAYCPELGEYIPYWYEGCKAKDDFYYNSMED